MLWVEVVIFEVEEIRLTVIQRTTTPQVPSGLANVTR